MLNEANDQHIFIFIFFFFLGPRPPNVESCYIKPCSYDMNRQGDRKKPKGHVGIEVTYSWRSNGFTPCSASCLGGKAPGINAEGISPPLFLFLKS